MVCKVNNFLQSFFKAIYFISVDSDLLFKGNNFLILV